MNAEMPMNFRNADARDRWITVNADYFTVVRRKNRELLRLEFKTQDEAETAARAIIKGEPGARLLIYAVHGNMSAYVKTMASHA